MTTQGQIFTVRTMRLETVVNYTVALMVKRQLKIYKTCECHQITLLFAAFTHKLTMLRSSKS